MIHSSNFLKTLMAFAAGLLVLSCTPTVIPELSLSDMAANFEAAGSLEKTISVTSNVDWTVSCPDTWVTVSPAAGTGNGSFKITVTANDKFETRSSTVTVKAGDKSASVKVSQLSLTPSILVNPTALEIEAVGGTANVDVTANSPWTVTVPEDCGWITAEPASGEGNGKVTLTVAASDVRVARSAVITFKETVGNSTMTVTVNQAAVELGHRADSLALVAIYNASDGANWAKNKWELDKPIDTWSAVTVTDGRVTALKISTSGVITQEWTLPEEIGDLTELTDLRINSNKLTGDLPESLYGLTKLEKLYLQNDNLTGSLSSKIAQLTQLTELYVDRNANMTGSIPAEIGSLKKLARLNISQSGIGGEIPAELGQCESLLQFMAFKTNLSGNLPDIWDMPVLQTVMLHTNPGLTGPLPASLGKLKPLESGTAPSIQIYGCNLTGTIPDSFAGLPEKTKQVYVDGNKMSGVISLTVQAHPNFASWRYDPQQEGYGLTLEEVNYRQADSLVLAKIYNIADGANWKESRKWTLTEPMDTWPGIKLNEEGRVTEMSITNGTVSTVEWEIPEELAGLTELSTLQIVGSKLKGQIPEFLYGMTSLSKVRLNGNNLTGAISDKISQLSNLTELYLNENKQFGGSLPAAMGKLKKLVSLNIAKTAITGAVPAELSGCESLQNFMAYEAQFTSIPDNWDQWPALKIVQLYGNTGLECPLPASLGKAKKITSLQLKNCNFTGNIPESYANLPTTCSQLFINGNKLQGVIPASVQAHANWTKWKPETNILPQQEGFGLTLD